MPVLAGIGIASMALSLFSGIFGGGSKRDAGYAGAALTDRQASNQAMVFQEQLRRKDIQNKQLLGANTAKADASGFQTTTGGVADRFQVTSTTQLYLDQMKQEMDRERQWSINQSREEIALLHARAQVQRQAADAGLTGDILGGVGGAVSGFETTSRGLGWIK